MSNQHSHAGVMDSAYAKGRLEKPHLLFRYKVRARMAVGAFRQFHPNWQDPISVLEMGAAEGKTLTHIRKLLNLPGQFVGVEYADELIEQADVLPEDTQLLQGDVMALPEAIDSESVHLCTALAVLEHLPEPQLCVNEAFRTLAPGGVFVATCPNPFWDHLAGKFGMVADEHHEVEVNKEMMIDMAKRAGFEHVSFTPFMWVLTGILPYLNVPMDPALSLKIDEMVESLKFLNFSFVNQALIAQKAR